MSLRFNRNAPFFILLSSLCFKEIRFTIQLLFFSSQPAGHCPSGGIAPIPCQGLVSPWIFAFQELHPCVRLIKICLVSASQSVAQEQTWSSFSTPPPLWAPPTLTASRPMLRCLCATWTPTPVMSTLVPWSTALPPWSSSGQLWCFVSALTVHFIKQKNYRVLKDLAFSKLLFFQKGWWD